MSCFASPFGIYRHPGIDNPMPSDLWAALEKCKVQGPDDVRLQAPRMKNAYTGCCCAFDALSCME